MSRPTIRRARPEERIRLLGLLVESFGDQAGHWTEEYWRWKHEDNPFGPSYLFVAEEDGRPVGLRVFLRWRFRSGDRTVDAVRAVDTATHPHHRREGIFSRLTREALEQVEADGLAFVFNTPNTRSRPGYLRLGWRDVGRVPLLVQPLRPFRMLRPGTWNANDETFVTGFPTLDGLLSSPDLDSAALDLGDRRLHTDRSRSYLTWRYGGIPGRRYHALWACEGEAFAALIFHNRRRRRRREVTLSEVLSSPDPDSRRLVEGLLRRLARETTADYLVASAAAATPEREVLRRAGFLPVPGIGPRFTVRKIRTGASPVDPYTWKSWRCSIGDLEIF